MGEKEEKRARTAETDKSPRKATRLEPPNSSRGHASEPDSPVVTDSECPAPPLLVRSDSMDVAAGFPCPHLFAEDEEAELLIAKMESLAHRPDPVCDSCRNPHKQKQQLIMLCTQCDQCLCTGVVNRGDRPRGHARPHARKNGHWVALWFHTPGTGYCFFCNNDVDIDTSVIQSDESDGDSAVNNESTSSEVENTAEGGHAHASVSNNDEGGYVVRGIPNLGNTCYMNALVQCLLVLDKLRTGMQRPNAPSGSIGMALKAFFAKTRTTNEAREMLNPQYLFSSMCALDPKKYNGNKMQDSHELLCSLRKWLNEEELNRSRTSGAAITSTVVDSIFQGELSTTRINKCCQYETVRYDPFHELPLPLPSKKHPNKKVQIITDGSDSGILHTKVESMAIEVLLNMMKPMEVDSLISVKVEEIHEPMVDPNSPEGTHTPPIVPLVRRKNAFTSPDSDVEETDNADDAYESDKPEADKEAKENTCMVQVTKEDKGKAFSFDFSYDENAKGSNFLASIIECMELLLKGEVVERHCEKCLEVPQQLSTAGSTLGKSSFTSVEVVQKYKREHAYQRMTISKLPPILTIQLMRFSKDTDDTSKQVKIKGYVSFEENLDVRQFMEPSSEDRENSRYRLVGIVEHIGDSLSSGHFVAYVRVNSVGSNKQLSNGSFSWFCANDGDIRQVSLEEVLKCEAFLLFYERMEG